jgi:hypothetical protein
MTLLLTHPRARTLTHTNTRARTHIHTAILASIIFVALRSMVQFDKYDKNCPSAH